MWHASCGSQPLAVTFYNPNMWEFEEPSFSVDMFSMIFFQTKIERIKKL